MSTEQENFDELLRSKLNENEFAFNEANWEKAEMLIIQAEKKRKRRIIGFIFFIGMLLGVCVMIPFIGGKNDMDKKDISGKQNIKIENKAKSEVKSEIIVENNYKGTKTVINTKETKENKQQTTSLSNNVMEENTTNNINQTKEKTIVANSFPSEAQKKNSSDVNLARIEKNSVTKAKEQKGRGNAFNNNETPSPVKENKVAETVAVKNNSKQEVEPNKTEEKKNADSFKDEKPNATLSKLDSTKAVTLANGNTKKDTIIAKDSLVKTKVDPVKPVEKDTAGIFKKLTIFSIDAGANYAFGWANNSVKEAAGFNAIFGVSVAHQFAKKWGVSIGVQYNSLAHLNYSNYTSNNLQYDVGYNQTKTIITPTILYYVAVPIKLQYHFNEKNTLSGGINTLYLLNTSSKVETYTESTFGAPVYKTATKMGYMDGFSTLDLQPSIAYRRRIVKCLSINAEVYYGLMDIKNNNTFNLTKSEHNSGVKLTLSYNFLHK